MVNADIEGDLQCDASSFSCPKGGSVNCAGMRANGRVFLGAHSQFDGQVILEGAYVRSDCFFMDSNFVNPDLFSVRAPGLEVGGRLMLLRSRFSGPFRLSESQVKRGMQIEGTTMNGLKHPVFDASNLRIESGLKVQDTNIVGGVLLVGSVFGGDLEFQRSHLSAANGHALDASRMRTNGSVLFSDGFTCEGDIFLTGGHTGGDLAFTGANAPTRVNGGLAANGMEIGRDVLFGANSKIGHDVDFSTSVIAGHFVVQDANWPREANLDLRFAKIHVIDDRADGWPAQGNLLLDGLEYDMVATCVSVEERLGWLSLQDDKAFYFQPYEQLAKYLRSHGHEDDADAVLIDKNRKYAMYRKTSMQSPDSLGDRLWYTVLGPKIDYGYNPWQLIVAPGPKWWHLFLWIPFWIFAGALVFCLAKGLHVLVPKSEALDVTENACHGRVSGLYPRFHWLVYSLEKFIPLVSFGQSECWVLSPGEHTVTRVLYRLFYAYYCVHILFGWILSTFLIIAISGLVKT